jgi:hypothetical protein
MRKFRKYEFGSKSAATTKIKALGVDEEGHPSHAHSIVVLGNIVTTEGVYDADDNEVTAPVVSSSWHVDVLWNGDPDPSWDNQMVWCVYPGVHSFGNSAAEEEFIKECKVQQPDLYPSEEEE